MKILFNTVIPVPFVVETMEVMSRFLDAEILYVFQKKKIERRAHWKTSFDGIYLSETKKERFDELKNILECEKPDICLFAHYRSKLTDIGIEWCKNNNKPYLIGPHEIIVPVNYLNPQFLYRKRSISNYVIESLKYIKYKKVVKHAAGVITMGANSLKNISKIYNGPIASIPYSFNMDHLYRNNCDLSEELVFLYSGQLVWNRNPILCIESFAHLLVNNPGKKLKLIISGKGDLDLKCRQTIDELGITDKVEWVTEFEDWYDIHTIYGKAHVLLALQTFSTWGLIIQEAMASGMGIISSYEIESATNLIIHRYNGFLTSLDRSSILRYMQEYVDDRNVLINHRARNRDIAPSIDAEATGIELGKFLLELLPESSAKL